MEKADLEQLAELSREIAATQRAVAELWQGVADRLETEAPIDEALRNLVVVEGDLAALFDRRREWGNRVDAFLAPEELASERVGKAHSQT